MLDQKLFVVRGGARFDALEPVLDRFRGNKV